MPLSKHFGGSGAKVMQSMRKSHPDYSPDRLKRLYYATENKQKDKKKPYVSLIK